MLAIVSDHFLDGVLARCAEDVPDVLLFAARAHVLDTLACVLAGASSEVSRVAQSAVRPIDGPCTVIASGRGSATDAAFLNGVAAHCLLFDDIYPGTAVHPGVVIVPATLAAVEVWRGDADRAPTMRDFLSAVVTGYEVTLALADALSTELIAAGFRTTSVLGTVGAATAAAVALRQSREVVHHAVNLAANFSGGLMEGWTTGTPEPFLQAGFAAQSGVRAALLAQAGCQTCPTTFTGTHGFLRAYRHSESNGPIRKVVGDDRWRILDVQAKRYPISAAKTPVVDATLEWVSRWGVVEPAVRPIRRIVASVPSVAKEYPGGDNSGPFTSPTHAQNSTQFCVAATLLGHPMRELRTYANGWADGQIAALAKIVELDGSDASGSCAICVEFEDGVVSQSTAAGQHVSDDPVAAALDKLRDAGQAVWPRQVIRGLIEVVTGDLSAPCTALTATLNDFD